MAYITISNIPKRWFQGLYVLCIVQEQCVVVICSHFKKRTFPMTETSGFLVRTIFVVVEK